jgi:hypothetical protein
MRAISLQPTATPQKQLTSTLSQGEPAGLAMDVARTESPCNHIVAGLDLSEEKIAFELNTSPRNPESTYEVLPRRSADGFTQSMLFCMCFA